MPGKPFQIVVDCTTECICCKTSKKKAVVDKDSATA